MLDPAVASKWTVDTIESQGSEIVDAGSSGDV